MMRVCNLDTCPAGIATQNPQLRKRFAGRPEHVINFMMFVARELREYMARLGIRTVDELVAAATCCGSGAPGDPPGGDPGPPGLLENPLGTGPLTSSPRRL